MNKRILIINGPNLNLLGTREPEIYGTTTFQAFLDELKDSFPETDFSYYQSNSEGSIIDYLQENSEKANGIVINAGGLYSYICGYSGFTGEHQNPKNRSSYKQCFPARIF